MSIIFEIDKSWLVSFVKYKHCFRISLGFIAITVWSLPYEVVLRLYRLDAVEKYKQGEWPDWEE